MKSPDIYKHILVDDYAATPKYLQLANAVIAAVRDGHIQPKEMLPSINDLSFELEIARVTVEKGYKYLKQKDILESVPGKGFFIKDAPRDYSQRIFLLFNKLSEHKKIIYDAFAATLGESATIDFYIYNNDFSLFKKFLTQKKEDYAYYVIIPHFIEGGENAYELINALPKQRLLILDKKLNGIDGRYAAVYEDFKNDIHAALEEALERLSKYDTLVIIFPENSYYPDEIIKGFETFCRQYAFTYRIISSVKDEDIQKGSVYINLMESDLVVLIEKILSLGLQVGQDVGVISYNEIPLKKLILNGITTISTDFEQIGQRAAQLILDKSTEHVKVPFHLRLRASL